MFVSHPARWILALVCSSLLAAGCSTDTAVPQGETGSLSLNLVIGDGIVINEVDWTITGNDMDMSGTIDTSAPGSTASVEVFGLPATIGEDYTFTMEAVSEDGETACKGSTDFGIDVGEVTEIMVVLQCKIPQRLGAVRVNGTFNICAELVKAVVSPLQTSVGNDIDLFAQGMDRDGDDIHYRWSATSGAIDDPDAASTTYTCLEAGDHAITISVTDDDEYCNMATWTIPVACVPGEAECQSDAQCDDGNQCTVDVCNDGACSNPNQQADFACDQGGGSVCDGNGNCVECNSDAQCAMGEVCTENACVPEAECMMDLDCADENQCTVDVCFDSACSNPNAEPGATCDQGGGSVCDGQGNCVACNTDADCAMGEVCTNNECVLEAECMMDSDCDDGNDCTADSCTAGQCLNPNQPADTDCTSGGGSVCDGNGACVECNSATQCPGGGECQVPACESNACALNDAADGTACLDNTGTCDTGVCEPNVEVEYAQDFESLAPTPSNSLVDDGWLGFVNVFSTDFSMYLGGYVKQPGTEVGGLAAIETGQGGDEQGLQVLAIISDYNNTPDQTAGNRVEANTFQERMIVADDVGKTLTFSFDAKRGNINDPNDANCASPNVCDSTANAFIKTFFNPGNLIDFPQVNTTAIPATWNRYSVTLGPIAGDLVGATLQFGFSATAQNFEPSQVFYDNILVTTE